MIPQRCPTCDSTWDDGRWEWHFEPRPLVTVPPADHYRLSEIRPIAVLVCNACDSALHEESDVGVRRLMNMRWVSQLILQARTNAYDRWEDTGYEFRTLDDARERADGYEQRGWETRIIERRVSERVVK